MKHHETVTLFQFPRDHEQQSDYHLHNTVATPLTRDGEVSNLMPINDLRT
jgi:hypothetical protein